MPKSILRKSLEVEVAQGGEQSPVVVRLLDPSELDYVSGGGHGQTGSGSFHQSGGNHTQGGAGQFHQSGGGYTQSGTANYTKTSFDDYLEGDF